MPIPDGPPALTPIGLALAQTARTVRRAFDAALAEAGGSLPVWLVLLNVRLGGAPRQRDLAAAVGLTEATLTHHLTALERDGLIARERDQSNRRVQLVSLTPAGEQRFLALAQVALAFDTRVRAGLSDTQQTELRALLEQLATNVSDTSDGPWRA